jgi:hypothetical protein
MVKILVINCGIHEKNRQGLIRILDYLKNNDHIIEYKSGSVSDIPNYDIIYSSSQIINTSLYPKKKFIFGPHFSTFPNDQQLHAFQNVHHNSIYIQPSEWTNQLWKNMGAEQVLQIKTFPFPVDTEKFKPSPHQHEHQPQPLQEKKNMFIYYKHRHPGELNLIKEFLAQQNIKNCRIFDYKQRYKEEDYLSYLQQCKYGIILDAHESQGFAIEEALSCNVPLLVWNAKTMDQEYSANYNAIPCTSIPYWNQQCGEYFHHYQELPATFQIFQSKLQRQKYYNPREYILENLSTRKCAERFMELINK